MNDSIPVKDLSTHTLSSYPWNKIVSTLCLDSEYRKLLASAVIFLTSCLQENNYRIRPWQLRTIREDGEEGPYFTASREEKKMLESLCLVLLGGGTEPLASWNVPLDIDGVADYT